jgi:hypothetical protein
MVHKKDTNYWQTQLENKEITLVVQIAGSGEETFGKFKKERRET